MKCLGRAGRAALIGRNEKMPVKRQCELLGVNRSGYYYEAVEQSEAEREAEEYVKKRIDYWHTKYCYMGVRKILDKLKKDDKIEGIGRKLVKRYMEEMGIYAVYPKPNLSKGCKEHKKFPYLLRNKIIFLPNQVWAIDITLYLIQKQSYVSDGNHQFRPRQSVHERRIYGVSTAKRHTPINGRQGALG